MEDLAESSESNQAVGSSLEMPKTNGPRVPRSALYLVVAEVFIAFGVWLYKRALMADLFGIGPEQIVMMNFAIGVVTATILTGLATIDWTVEVLCLNAAFHVLLIVWMLLPSGTCHVCPDLAPTLSMFLTTLEPIRLAFISDQLTLADPAVIRPYFTFVAGSWFMGFAIVQLVTYFLEGPTMVPAVNATVLTIFTLYTALVLFIQTSNQDNRARYCRRFKLAAVEIYRTHEGKKYWDMLHIGITLTGHYGSRLILNLAQKEQLRSIQYAGNLPGIAASVITALPSLLAVVIIVIMGFGVTPLVKRRYQKEITDLQYIGLGMIFGCISILFTLVIQMYIDKELKPPRRQESLLFLFNLLPSNTTFKSKVFGGHEGDFIQVEGTSSTVFLSRNVAEEDEYPISVINLKERMYEETFITLIEGATVSYVVARGQFKYVSGLDLHTHHFMGKDSTLFLGCALNSSACEGKEIQFVGTGGTIEETLPPRDMFKDVLLPDGNYNITGTIDGEVTTLSTNFSTKSQNLYTGIVYEREPGVPDIAIFPTSEPVEFPIELYIFQQITIAFKEAFFTVGLLGFLYYQTRPNHPARPFIYSAFFYIFEGVPSIFIGGLRMTVFHFLEEFVVHVVLVYYACCTVLFINLANKYEHWTWREDDDED